MNLLVYIIYRVKALASMIGVRNPISWTRQDKANFQNFLRTQTGQRFIHGLRNAALEATARSVYVNDKSATAIGWQAAFAYVCQQSAMDPLRVAQHDGRVSLTETQVDTSDDEEESESLSSNPQGLGSSIGMR